MDLDTPHTLGINGVGPRTFRDSYNFARFNFHIMAEIVAERLADYDFVEPGFMSRYRECRETFLAVRAAYLGV